MQKRHWQKPYHDIPPNLAQHVILTDDASTDNTVRAANGLILTSSFNMNSIRDMVQTKNLVIERHLI